jgi:hypothetical protein
MDSSRLALAASVALSLVGGSALSQDHQGHGSHLGSVKFATSCDPAVTADFDRSVALVHSFEFGASIRGFGEVLAVDSTCAMAHWGLALSRWTNPMAAGRRPDPAFAALVAAYVVYGLAFIWRTSFDIGGRRWFSLFDDAMISMRYARNLAAGHGLVWNPGERVEGITNPLWTLWLAVLHLFPVQADYGVERDEYNQNVRSSFERMRDFQSAHYLLNHYGLSRADGNFWSRARAVPASAELQHKIDAFRARGECVHYEDEAFTIDDWQALLLGHGVCPESHDPAVERTPAELRAGELARIEDFIRRKVEGQRSHEAYLHSVCAPRAGAATTH